VTAPFPSPPRRRRRGRTVLVALAVLVGILVLANNTQTSSTGGAARPATSGIAGPVDADPSPAAPAAAGIGTEVRDGKFAFVVTDVETGVQKLGREPFVSTPQGSYVLVRLRVTNVGDEAQMFSGSSQKLRDAQGREFEADSGAAVLSVPDSESFLNTINPGNSVDGTLVFDVPKGLAPTAIELHDSPFSGGATVTLAG
jgi:hypothetical protein